MANGAILRQHRQARWHVIDESGHEASDLQALIPLLRDTAEEIKHHEVVSRRPIARLTFDVKGERHNPLMELPVEAYVPKLQDMRPTW